MPFRHLQAYTEIESVQDDRTFVLKVGEVKRKLYCSLFNDQHKSLLLCWFFYLIKHLTTSQRKCLISLVQKKGGKNQLLIYPGQFNYMEDNYGRK